MTDNQPSSRWLKRMDSGDLARLDLASILSNTDNWAERFTFIARQRAAEVVSGRDPDAIQALVDVIDELRDMARDLGSATDAAQVLEAQAITAALDAARL